MHLPPRRELPLRVTTATAAVLLLAGSGCTQGTSTTAPGTATRSSPEGPAATSAPGSGTGSGAGSATAPSSRPSDRDQDPSPERSPSRNGTPGETEQPSGSRLPGNSGSSPGGGGARSEAPSGSGPSRTDPSSPRTGGEESPPTAEPSSPATPGNTPSDRPTRDPGMPVLTAITTSSDPTYERVVLELNPGSYRPQIRTAESQGSTVTAPGSGRQVQVPGDHALLVTLDPAATERVAPVRAEGPVVAGARVLGSSEDGSTVAIGVYGHDDLKPTIRPQRHRIAIMLPRPEENPGDSDAGQDGGGGPEGPDRGSGDGATATPAPEPGTEPESSAGAGQEPGAGDGRPGS